MVKGFVKKLFLFIVINLVLAGILLFIIKHIEPSFARTDENTEASFSAIPSGKEFDMVILGTSHAREFTRSGNKPAVESILNKKVWNLSKGFGHGGLVPSIASWDLFQQRKNKTKSLVYFLDPWVFYYSKWNEDNYFLEDEPLRWDILQNAINHHAGFPVLINYIKSKFKPSYFLQAPLSADRNHEHLDSLNNWNAKKQMKTYYPEPIDVEAVGKYQKLFLEFVEDLRREGIDPVIIVPPSLLTKEPGFDTTMKFLKSIDKLKVYDHSNVIRMPGYYYDVTHLNSKGIEYYTKQYLTPVL